MNPIRDDPVPIAEQSAIGSETAPGPGTSARPSDRRMQLRAYNHWAGLLGRGRFPSIKDLDTGGLGEIGLHSVLLDFAAGCDSPAIAYLGARLAEECGAEVGTLRSLDEAPAGSLLAQLARHCPELLANRAPTAFEAEFMGSRGAIVLYRGVLLPFSSDDDAIEYVLAVINWKEQAEDDSTPSQREADVQPPAARRVPSPSLVLTDWADGPGSALAEEQGGLVSSGLPGTLAESLRAQPLLPLSALPPAGAEFSLAMIRRSEDGTVSLVGELPHDAGLVAEAAQRLAR
jgi:hypothetical protein